MTDYTQLIPELKDWNNGQGIDPAYWIGCVGTFQFAVGYSALFWPSFVVFEGYVLREGFTVENLRAWEQQCGNNQRAIESVLNHLHIADTHYVGCPDISQERVIHLGRTLRDIYAAKLAWQFPDRSFTVSFDDSAQNELSDYELTFFQNERNV